VVYKAPVYENFCNISYYDKPISIYDSTICPDNMTVGTCNALVKEKQSTLDIQSQKQEQCAKEFMEADKVYGKNLFIINNIAGIIAVIASLFLFSMINIAAGTAFSGLALIIWGFMRGWQGTGDILKFVVALIVAILFVIFAVMVNKRYSKITKEVSVVT
jgi:Ca2+/Na+ antiporter